MPVVRTEGLFFGFVSLKYTKSFFFFRKKRRKLIAVFVVELRPSAPRCDTTLWNSVH